jgi:enoyl-CoA hydratase/carnithine racemase
MPEHDALETHHLPGGIHIITLNRPEAMNAITLPMAQELTRLLDALAADCEARCIIITGAGARAFSAGFDIREMAAFSPTQMRDAFIARDPIPLQIAQHPLPVIAALNGLAHGAGALIAAACDFRVACDRTRLKVTAIGYGSANATWSLPRLVGIARAKDILLTGREVSAEEGLAIGLFDRLADDGDTLKTAIALARDICRHPKAGTDAVKSLVDHSPALSLIQGWQAEHDAMLAAFETRPVGGSQVFSGFLSKHQD